MKSLQDKLIEFFVLYVFENVKCYFYVNHDAILFNEFASIFKRERRQKRGKGHPESWIHADKQNRIDEA